MSRRKEGWLSDWLRRNGERLGMEGRGVFC